MKVPFPQTISLVVLLILGVLTLSCAGPNGASEAESPSEEGRDEAPQTELQFEGTVQYRDLEGGAWVIESSDGTTYDPMNLPEEYKEEGLSVRVWADRAEEQASIRMMGPIISIKRIERSSPD